MDIDQLYEAWCKKVSEPDLMEELNLIRHQEKEIESRFYKQLSFGTAGLRAEVGVGCARMNVYTVRLGTISKKARIEIRGRHCLRLPPEIHGICAGSGLRIGAKRHQGLFV